MFVHSLLSLCKNHKDFNSLFRIPVESRHYFLNKNFVNEKNLHSIPE